MGLAPGWAWAPEPPGSPLVFADRIAALGPREPREWGAALFDAGYGGHFDSKTGFGPWPTGERLVADLSR